MNRSRIAALGLLTCFAAGCDDPTGSLAEPGSLSFQFTGGLPGQFETAAFSASGAARLDAGGRPAVGEWAAAGPHPRENVLVPAGSKLAVEAFIPTDSRQGRLFVLTLPRVSSPTTVAIDANCTAVGCAQALVLLGVSPRAPHEGLEGSCVLNTGTVVITDAADGRIRGTFSGVGSCTEDVRTAPFFDITVEDGAFDVQVVEALRTGLQLWS